MTGVAINPPPTGTVLKNTADSVMIVALLVTGTRRLFRPCNLLRTSTLPQAVIFAVTGHRNMRHRTKQAYQCKDVMKVEGLLTLSAQQFGPLTSHRDDPATDKLSTSDKHAAEVRP